VTEDIRVGIVGATVTTGGSGWGARAHVPALHATPGVELRAVCGSREDTARASAAAFGAPLAFHDIEEMAAHPEVDLVVVSVRLSGHHRLAIAALGAGKPVLCEWPLAGNLLQAREMADAARERSLATIVGLQGRSDPTIQYARDLVADGYVGEVLSATLVVTCSLPVETGPGRIWQADRAAGGNSLSMVGGHSIDALCFVLGEPAVVAARMAIQVPQWRNTETGEWVDVTAPDTTSIIGRLAGGAEFVASISGVPSGPLGTRIEIRGDDGTMVLTSNPLSVGPAMLVGARHAEQMAELSPPERYVLIPPEVPAGPPRNVAQAYARIVAAHRDGGLHTIDVDFDLAVRRHRLIDAVQRSAADDRPVTL
jgi:predicted dehydrogenase